MSHSRLTITASRASACYALRMTTLAAAFDRLHDPDDWDAGLVEQLQQLKVQHGGPAVEVDGDVTVDCCTVYAGSLHVRGDFVFSSHVLVLGDLIVDGVVIGEPEHAILMVLGNLSSRAMAFLRSYLCITGNVDCRELFLGTCDGFAKVGGEVSVGLLLQEHFELMSLDNDDAPRMHARFWCDIRAEGYRTAYPRPRCTSQPAAALAADVYSKCSVDDDGNPGEFDKWKLLALVQAGTSLGFREPSTTTSHSIE